jgi:hypothetical protein
MKRLFNILGYIFVFVVIVPLFLLMFFAMPLEFIVSSWHIIKVDSSTQGIITHSEVVRESRGTERSDIMYTFECGGKSYQSSRWQPGLISNSAGETNGGEFSRSHPEGTKVTVHYDSSNPSFSIIERGWPKWSIGFSLGVWGIFFSNQFKCTAPRTTKLLINYPLSRAISFTGVLTLFVFPQNLNTSSLKLLLLAFIIFGIAAYVWLILCPKEKITAKE